MSTKSLKKSKFKSNNLINNSIKDELDYFVDKYNTVEFIQNDPISIPHQFSSKKDIEIISILVSTIAWGNRLSIVKSGLKLIEIMNGEPYKFISKYCEKDLDILGDFKHRTFNSFDLHFYLLRLKYIYEKWNGIENVFKKGFSIDGSAASAISFYRKVVISEEFTGIRTSKHIANPANGSAAKRLNMFLRWMVRKDNRGVDFGLWKTIPASILSCPLDVHSGRSARKYGLIKRKFNDIKAVNELDGSLRHLDPKDPVKYDFALFGIGVEKNELV